MLASGLWAGCNKPAAQVTVVDHTGEGELRRYAEFFPEAYYSVDSMGNVDVVLRRTQPSRTNPAGNVTQLVHLRTVWKSRPGRTIAETTQINGTLRYQLLTGADEATYEGGGSVFLHENRGKTRLNGKVEYATVRGRHSADNAAAVFEKVELSGAFRAVHDPRRTVRLMNEMQARAQRGESAGSS